jgi:hypothetical protein
LEALRKVDVETLTRVESVQTIFPYFGPGMEEMFEAGRAPDYANATQLVSEGPWVEDVVVGDCQFEGSAFAPFLSHVDSRKLVRHFKTISGVSVAEKLLNVYGIDSKGHMDGNSFWANVMLLVVDAFLSEPMETLADTLARVDICGAAVVRTGDEGRREAAQSIQVQAEPDESAARIRMLLRHRPPRRGQSLPIPESPGAVSAAKERLHRSTGA